MTTIQETPLPPVPSAQIFIDKTGHLTQPAQQWLVTLQAKVNTINATLVAISGASSPTAAFNTLSPLTTTGDLLTYSGGTNTRLPIGTNGYVLTVVSGQADWAAGGGGGGSPLTTKGDLYGYSTTNTRIPVGTEGQVLTADSTQTAGLRWASPGVGTVPLSANFTSFGTGITTADANGRLRVSVTQGTVLRGLTQASIATPYTIDINFGFLSAPTVNDAVWAGIGLSNGTAFRAFYCGAIAANTSKPNLEFAIDSWSNSTTYVASIVTSGMLFNPSNTYLRITDDGTTRKFYFSSNGLDFVLVYSEASNTYVTPTEFGIVCYNDSQNSYTANISVTNWLITNSVLGDAP